MRSRSIEIGPSLATPLFFFATLLAVCLASPAEAKPPAQSNPEPAASQSSSADVNTDENLVLQAKQADTWSHGQTTILQLTGPVSIDLERTHLVADNAVVWLSPDPKAVLLEQKVEIALIGHVVLTQGDQNTRSGDTLFVNGIVRGSVQLKADQRRSKDQGESDLYRQARGMRPQPITRVQEGEEKWLLNQPWLLPPGPTTRTTGPAGPTTKEVRTFPITFNMDQFESVQAFDGTTALILTGNVKLSQARPADELYEMQADRAVLFTTMHKLMESEKGQESKSYGDSITAAYLEGDVRVIHTPPRKKGAEAIQEASRLYFDFQTDQAIMTQAVVHTLDPNSQSPLIIRAKVMRQLSQGEYTANQVELTSSSFATPSYNIGMDKAYIRQIDTGDVRYGSLTTYAGEDVTYDVYHVPLFYTPYTSGTMTDHGQLLRNIDLKEDSVFGESFETEWGLFETLGQVPPTNKQNDITYVINEYTERGPAFGINAKYGDGFITPVEKQPWDFEGHLTGIFVDDHGIDDLGDGRDLVTPETTNRGRIVYNHQQFLPDDWQVQITAAYFSDPTFQEEYYQDDFDSNSPQQTSFYAKQQRDQGAVTFLASFQPNRFVTNADSLQDNFEVEHMPEIGYRRIGDSLAEDNLTFFSDNTFDGLRFHRSAATMADLGFDPLEPSPGLPVLGTSGTVSSPVYRGDFREEFDAPFTAGHFRVVPYVFGRYTGYSASPEDNGQNRIFAGGGVRLSTTFWRVDDTVSSDLFDLHRLRHIVEPQLNIFTSAENVSRDHLFQYDPEVDQINAISAVSLALNQRWQTKRGGPGRWRTADVFTLNISANFYANRPKDELQNPTDFRGLFFESLPEASIPRNSINSDFIWRVSDSTAVLGDAAYNPDARDLATASLGLAVRRDQRISYFLGQRYIHDLDSNISTVAANYELTSKYRLTFRQSFDFGIKRNVSSNISLIRELDRFYLTVDLHYDAVNHQSGFGIGIIPQDFIPGGLSTDSLQSVFSN